MNIIIYDDTNIEYYTGILRNVNTEPYWVTLDNGIREITKPTGQARMSFDIDNYDRIETIKLDDTLMRRIAKYNKEIELLKIDKQIEEKEKRLKELEDKIEDKEQRWQKIKDYVANIYEIPLEEDDYNYSDY